MTLALEQISDELLTLAIVSRAMKVFCLFNRRNASDYAEVDSSNEGFVIDRFIRFNSVFLKSAEDQLIDFSGCFLHIEVFCGCGRGNREAQTESSKQKRQG